MNKLKSITFIKSSPVKLSDLFNIPKDNSSWNYNYHMIELVEGVKNDKRRNIKI